MSTKRLLGLSVLGVLGAPRLLVALLALLALGMPVEPLHAQADLSLGDEAVMAAGTVESALFLTSNPGATAMQVDVLYDSALLSAGTPVAGAGLADHVVASIEPVAGLLRLVIYSPTNALLAVGEVARVPFTAAVGAAPGVTPLDPTAVEVATPAAGNVLPVSAASGSIHIFALQANLAVQLGAGATLVANGDPLSYTLVANNPGPDAVTSVDVTDPAPAELTGVSWTCVASGGATCAASGTNDLIDTVDLPVGGAATYTLVGTVSTGNTFIDNFADLQPPIEVFDPSTADNSDSVSVDVCTIDNNVLTGRDIGGVEVFNACVTLTAGPSFNIQPTGIVTLRAFGSVILANGFSVETGGRLTLEIP